MFEHLQIPYQRDRLLVGMADGGLELVKLLGWPPAGIPQAHDAPRRILLLRLERVGDLLMALDAIALARALAPQSEITLAVGSWNLAIARLIRDVDRIDVIDAPWMARGSSGASWTALAQMTRVWRRRHYDLGVNLEPDIRSNLLLALSGARRRVGFLSGGGGALLTDALALDPAAHVAQNATRVVRLALGARDARIEQATGRLHIPDEARRRASELLSHARTGTQLIGIQPGAGRSIKEWDPARFAEVGARLAVRPGTSVILIGSAADRPALDGFRAAWPGDVPLTQLPVDADLVVLAAVLEQLSLFITGDTGPMHLAAAVGTPVLAIFGPSLPTRYAPLAARSRIVRIDIACSPCNLLRRPPARCVGHVPDCLAGITSAEVLQAADELLHAS